MTPKRWIKVNRTGEGLTEEEIKEGWHFCPDWDFLLVGPNMPEIQGCVCKQGKCTHGN